MNKVAAGLCLALTAAHSHAAEPMAEMQVVGERLVGLTGRQTFSHDLLTAEDLARSPALRLDDTLRRLPGFSLFRRSSSRSANPTTQGVTLRGIGPNGAGRTSVLLDGVPINDPFGGWVHWAAFDPGAIDSVEIVRGGGSGLYGSQALAGSIALRSRVPDSNRFSGQASYGNAGTIDTSARLEGRQGGFYGAAFAHYFQSDGFFIVAPDDRGPIDIPAAADALTFGGRAGWQGGRHRLAGRVAYFSENRVNGLALAPNATERADAALRWLYDGGGEAISAEAVLWYTRVDFANAFAAVDAERASARAVLDQFDVPGEGYGGRLTLRRPLGAVVLEAGVDGRRLSGTTNERFRNLLIDGIETGFTRQRTAGGEQSLIGGYAEMVADMAAWQLTAGIRTDRWRVFDGQRRESDLADGTILTDLMIADRTGTSINGRLGAARRLGAFTIAAAGYGAFRLPTINEFFRPFRVGNDITEANPALGPERLYGAEARLAYQPLNTISVSLAYFRNWLEDGVGNLTVTTNAGFFSPDGFIPGTFIPPGGSLRQRRPIDLIIADGVEINAEAILFAGLTARLDYQFVAARIATSSTAPGLVGNRVAQSPRHRLTAGFDWAVRERLSLSGDLRYLSRQFEDDLNSRVLDEATIIDLGARFRLSDRLSLLAAVENLADARIEAGIAATGLTTLASPRLWRVGLSLTSQ